MVDSMTCSRRWPLAALALVALATSVPLVQDASRTWRAAGVGLLLGAAVVSKATALPLVAGVALALLVRHRGRGVVPATAVLAGAVATSGAWFGWNLARYGHPLGVVLGDAFAPYPLRGPGDLLAAPRNVVTYLWLSVEQFGNRIESPPLLDACVLLVTLAVLVAAVARLIRTTTQDQRLDPAVMAHVGIACATALLAWWLAFYVERALAFRTAYASLPLWAILVLAAATPPPRRAPLVAVLVLGVVALAHAWTLSGL